MQTLWQDIRYSARVLLKRPGFALIAIATLALVIGATSSIFSVVNSVLLKALPYKDPERLVLIWGTDRDDNQRGQVSFTDLEEWRQQAKSFTEIVAYDGTANPILSGNNEPERVAAMQVSDGARLLTSLLYEVSSSDPLTLIAVALLLGLVAVFACFVPAQRATKVDPLVVLRYE